MNIQQPHPLSIDQLFNEISDIFHEITPKKFDLLISKLEELAQRNLTSEGHINSYCVPINNADTQITEEQFWKVVKCKARQPTLVVDRIAKSNIVDEREDGFTREIVYQNESMPRKEDVWIHADSKAALFRMKAPLRFVAINKIIKRDEELFFQGTYMDENAIKKEEFAEKVQSLLTNMRNLVIEGKIEDLYQQIFQGKLS